VSETPPEVENPGYVKPGTGQGDTTAPDGSTAFAPPPGFAAFLMIRDEDETGISGTGVVAEGVRFSDGRVVIRWQTHGAHHSTVVWDSIESVLAIHGHNGRTWLQWASDIAWPPKDEGRP